MVAFGLRPQVRRVEGPLAVPGTVDLELDRLVGALGLGVTNHLVASRLDVSAGGGIDGDPARCCATDAGITPDGQRLAGVADRKERRGTAGRVVDADVIECIDHGAVGRVDPPRPGLVDHALESEDRLVLVHRVDVAVHALAQVRHRHVELGVHRPDLRAKDRRQVGRARDRIDGRGVPVEHEERAFIGQATGKSVVHRIRDRQVVPAQVAEQLGAAVALHVPGEAEARRDQVVHLDEAGADGGLVVEVVDAHTKVQHQVGSGAPDILQVHGTGFGLEHAAVSASTAEQVGVDANGERSAVVQDLAGAGTPEDGVDGLGRPRVTRVAVGSHHLVVQAKAQQVVAQGPLEIEPARLALILVVDDRTAGVATQRRPAQSGVGRVVGGGVEGHPIAQSVRRRAGPRNSAVEAIHCLDHEVLGKEAGVGDRAVLAAALGEIVALAPPNNRVGEVVTVGIAAGVTLVREGQQFHQVVVTQAPVQLGTPEAVARFGLCPGTADAIGEARFAVPEFVHGEQEQAVLDDRPRRPSIQLGKALHVAARARINVAPDRVGIEVVLCLCTEGSRFERELESGLEFVAPGSGYGIDHAAGAAAELDRITAGLDLEFLEERERRGGKTLAAIEVGDVQPVDEDRVFRNGGTAERDAAEGRIAADHARREKCDAAQRLRHRQATDFLAGNVGGGFSGAHVDPVYHPRAEHLHRIQVGEAAIIPQIDGGRATQRHADGDRLSNGLLAASDLQGVIPGRQLPEAIHPVRAHGYAAAQPGGAVGDGDLVAGTGSARHCAGGALGQDRCSQRREAQAHGDAEDGLAQAAVAHRALRWKLRCGRGRGGSGGGCDLVHPVGPCNRYVHACVTRSRNSVNNLFFSYKLRELGISHRTIGW